MVIKQLSCVFRLKDSCMNRVLSSNEAAFRCGGIRLRHEYKVGGYFVLTDMPEGDYIITVTAIGCQQENVPITVKYDGSNAMDKVIFLSLNPSPQHPYAGRFPSLYAAAEGCTEVYALSPVGILRVAEDKAAAGADSLRMFAEGKNPVLPSDFLLGSGSKAETVTFTDAQSGIYRTRQPLRYAHKRSEPAQPMIRLQCGEDGRFFLLMGSAFSADKQTGKIPLTFAAERAGKLLTACVEVAPARFADIGALNFTGGK